MLHLSQRTGFYLLSKAMFIPLSDGHLLFQRLSHKLIQGYAHHGSLLNNHIVKIRRYPYIEAALKGPFGLLAGFFTKFKVIVYRFVKGIDELGDTLALERNQITDSHNFAMKYLILCAEMYGTKKVFVF
jgi:hypothetical protein